MPLQVTNNVKELWNWAMDRDCKNLRDGIERASTALDRLVIEKDINYSATEDP